MATPGRPWSRYSGDGEGEIAQLSMQPDQGAKAFPLGDPRDWEDDWWPVNPVPDRETDQHEAMHCRTDFAFCSTNSWNQSLGSELQKRVLFSDERQMDDLAGVGCILYNYQNENIGSECSQWTSELISNGLPLSSIPPHAGGHGVMLRSQRRSSNHFGHSDTVLNGVRPGFGGETFSICDSKFGAHSTDDFGQDTWGTSSSREYSWSSPFTVPYSVFEEEPSQCCYSNTQNSIHRWWDQMHMGESDGQSIKTEPPSRGNWADDSLAVVQEYDSFVETPAVSPESLESLQNSPGGSLGLPEDPGFPALMNIGEVMSGIIGETLPLAGQHGDNIPYQLPSSSRKNILTTLGPCEDSRVGIFPRLEQSLYNPPSVTPHRDDRAADYSRPQVQSHQRQPRNQRSSRYSIPKLIHPKLPSYERNWCSSSFGSRSALTQHPPPRGRTNPNGRAAQRKIMRDQFLIESKLAGMSYKEIREKGNFSEAESTLRGRFRTLTKEKGQRVRKPEWEEEDVRLLKRAVEDLAAGSDKTQASSPQTSKNVKIPWKQVAEYIAKHGGSYHFGNATCRKKWDEIRNGSLNDGRLRRTNGE